jgi:AcrR family transcriptional regulator
MASTKSESLRRTVLDAAVAISAVSGPDAISMREVAREAGVSHQAPYHHFTDRSGIFAAICEEGFRQLSEDLKLLSYLGLNQHCWLWLHCQHLALTM